MSMQAHKHLLRSVLARTAIASVALGSLLLVGVPKAKADGWDDCNRRIAFTEYRLHEAIEHFGYYSPQANHWRHEHAEAYERLERYRYNHRREEWREHEWREHRDHDRYYYNHDRY
jgi:hypothetical protein